ncbi:MAG: carboxypeptidase-like regulatory domain-containing protein [Bacteroidota bacterium]
MKFTRHLVVFITFLVASSTLNKSNAQVFVDTTKLVQLSGIAVNEEDLQPVSYATIFDRTIKRGMISDFHGFFTLVVMPGDTLVFSGYGFNTTTFIVPDTLKDNRYSMIHMMQKDTVELPAVTVYPWPSREDFAYYFVHMEPYDDAMRRAQRELSGEALAFVAARLEGDASLSYGTVVNQRYSKLYTNGQLPVNNLLNPYSWAKLIKDWKEGKLSRQ